MSHDSTAAQPREILDTHTNAGLRRTRMGGRPAGERRAGANASIAGHRTPTRLLLADCPDVLLGASERDGLLTFKGLKIGMSLVLHAVLSRRDQRFVMQRIVWPVARVISLPELPRLSSPLYKL